MLKVSLPAVERMTDLLLAKADDAVLRIVRKKGRLHLWVSQIRKGDQTFAHEGRVLLTLDGPTNKTLAKTSLNIRQTVAGPRLKIARN
jgi:hypothetical protein